MIEQNEYKRGYDDGCAKGYSAGYNIAEDKSIKFYYCGSNGKHYVGKRLDTMYYAEVIVYPLGEVCLNYQMSRYLPWGEYVDGYQYQSEPKEISFEEWLEWFIKEITNGRKENTEE